MLYTYSNFFEIFSKIGFTYLKNYNKKIQESFIQKVISKNTHN